MTVKPKGGADQYWYGFRAEPGSAGLDLHRRESGSIGSQARVFDRSCPLARSRGVRRSLRLASCRRRGQMTDMAQAGEQDPPRHASATRSFELSMDRVRKGLCPARRSGSDRPPSGTAWCDAVRHRTRTSGAPASRVSDRSLCPGPPRRGVAEVLGITEGRFPGHRTSGPSGRDQLTGCRHPDGRHECGPKCRATRVERPERACTCSRRGDVSRPLSAILRRKRMVRGTATHGAFSHTVSPLKVSFAASRCARPTPGEDHVAGTTGTLRNRHLTPMLSPNDAIDAPGCR